MTSEHPRARNAHKKDHDLQNLEIIEDILLTGTRERLDELQAFHGLTAEQMEQAIYHTKMRDELHKRSLEEQETRIQTRPEASREEKDIGSYWEGLESTVREAVKTVQRKGYSTFESGFAGIGGNQLIGFNPPLPMEFDLPKESYAHLAAQGIRLSVMPNTILFEPNRKLTVEELTNVWNEIAEAMPDMGYRASPSQTKVAQHFREKHA